jgi:diketogulonate reductase-like aldo/keto reductase
MLRPQAAAVLVCSGALLFGLRQRARALHGPAAAAAAAASAAATTTAETAASSQPANPGWRNVTYRLNDGRLHPAVGFGTYKVLFIPGSASGQNGVARVCEEHDASELVRAATALGVRLWDCASYYGNEDRIGAALQAFGPPRSELFLVSKVWTSAIYEGRAAIRAQLEATLRDLRTDYLDLYLLHWPVPGRNVEAWRALEELRAEGKVRSIGVSNYTVEDLEELARHSSSRPAVNQLEVNPFLFRSRTLAYCRAQGIVVQAYRPLANGKALAHPVLCEIARAHGRAPSQILGRFALQQGCVLLTKSTRTERLRENLDLDGFELSRAELARLEALSTPTAIEAFAELYRKCVIRDTPLEALAKAGHDVGVPARSGFTAD